MDSSITPEQLALLTTRLMGHVEDAVDNALISGDRKMSKLNTIQQSMKKAVNEKIPQVDQSLAETHLLSDKRLGVSSDMEKFPIIFKTYAEVYSKMRDESSNADQNSSDNLFSDVYKTLTEDLDIESPIQGDQHEEDDVQQEDEIADLIQQEVQESARVPEDDQQFQDVGLDKENDDDDAEMGNLNNIAYAPPSSPESSITSPTVSERRVTRARKTAAAAQQEGDRTTTTNQQAGSRNQVEDKTILKAAVPQKETSISSAADEVLPSFVNGQLTTDHLRVGSQVLARLIKTKDKWLKGEVQSVVYENGTPIKYKVKMLGHRRYIRNVPIDDLACPETISSLNVKSSLLGARVAAHYEKDGMFSAIVAEGASRYNRNRLLLFYYDGYATYCELDQVCLSYGIQTESWRDVPDTSELGAEFVRDFLAEKRRTLLKMERNKNYFVEYCGETLQAKVTRVDCSLVHMRYDKDNADECIYRGSLRFPTLSKYKKKLEEEMKNNGGNPIATTRKQASEFDFIDINSFAEEEKMNEKEEDAPAPVIDNLMTSSSSEECEDADDEEWGKENDGPPRQKSQHKKKEVLHFTEDEHRSLLDASGVFDDVVMSDGEFDSDCDLPVSGIDLTLLSKKGPERRKQLRKRAIMRTRIFDCLLKFDHHKCKADCLKNYHPPSADVLYATNPLQKPLYAGWKRRCAKYTSNKVDTQHQVFYIAPCKRRLRSLADVSSYLAFHKIEYLDIDYFTFETAIRVQYVKVHPPNMGWMIDDYTNGEEDVPVSCVNHIDDVHPNNIPYTKNRMPGTGVDINVDLDYMVCCSCTDGCRDRDKCECQQLTIQSTECSYKSRINKKAGYKHKRLKKLIGTGLYECNKNCGCNRTCPNRVVQNGLQMRLQLFKTYAKGWAVRCLDDIDQGAFVCIYTGLILSEKTANQDGLKDGDEYLADLDLIEVAENSKVEETNPGLDSSGIELDDSLSDFCMEPVRTKKQNEDTTDSESDGILESPPHPCINSNEEEKSFKTYDPKADTFKERKKGGRKKKVTAEEEEKKKKAEEEELNETVRDNRTRRLFGETEDPYIIDAKKTGNLGRYLNHSCDPNLFVQNVFIDTHDLRFPWVAFFAKRMIRAGNELTWDYNYELGSVPSKEIMCHCGAAICRKRLL